MKNPCWKNYKMLGTKEKNGKTVPNCVKKESDAIFTHISGLIKDQKPLNEEQRKRASKAWMEHLNRKKG